MKRRRRDSEHGFALVIVLVMAAVVAISLYIEAPRFLFEAQRAKEQLLIDRGNEYKRAIKVYVRKMQGRYPPTIDALVETNDIHFLRKKFKDPMTGKDEWRLIHIAGGGIFPDSLTQAPPKPNANASFVSGTGSDTGEPTPQPMWVQRLRPSDSGTGMVGVMAQSRSSDQDQSQADEQALQPGQTQPGQQAADPQIAGVLGAAQPQQASGQTPGQAQGQTPGQPGYPTQNIPGLPGPYGTPVQGGMVGGIVGGGVQGGIVTAGPGAGMPPSGPGTLGGSGAPGSGGVFRVGGMTPANPQGGGTTGSQPIYTGFTSNDPQSAQQMIQTMLRGGGGVGSGSGNVIGALIAGVASQSEFEGIKNLDKRSKYKEWEFIYDMRKELMPGMGVPTKGFQGQPGPGK